MGGDFKIWTKKELRQSSKHFVMKMLSDKQNAKCVKSGEKQLICGTEVITNVTTPFIE